MFSLTKEKTVIKKEYPDPIREIHEDFFNESEKLLEEAILILNGSVKANKAKRLSNLGFKENIEVKKIIHFEPELVAEYALKYPNYKFITETIVQTLCKKYKLVLGDIGQYTGFVPLDKVDEIEIFSSKYDYKFKFFNFKMRNKDFCDGDDYLKQLKICAPLHDIKLKWNQQVSEDYKVETVLDPIVLQPVRGGYLIVCAWGDEASDELVTGE